MTEKQQAAAAIALQRQRSSALIAQFKQEEREATRAAQTRLREESRALRQKIAEENRAAREVARINAETARQAAAQERIRERAAKQLADVQIREARRAARELERSLAVGRGQRGGGFDLSGLTSVTGQIPALGGLTSQLSAVSAASTSAGAATASMAGPIGIAVAAFLAEAAAVAAVSKGLFDLTKQTADFQGKLFDMSQQVGISVETLSALEVLATTTGGNIETVAASIAIFQRNLEQAHDPTSTEAELLASLGVTATDTEEALRQTISGLFALGEGSRQTDAALQLFGRSGRFINAILKESHGDLDKAIARFRELGIIVSTEDAKAADEFNDTLATLNFQIRAVTAEIGNELVPIVTSGLKQIQKIVKENKDGIEAIGVVFRGLAVLIGGPIVGSIQILGIVWKAHQPVIKTVVDLYERLAAAMQLVADRVPDIQGNEIPAQDLTGEKSGIKLLREIAPFFKTQIKEDPLKGLRDFFERNKEKDAAADAAAALLRQLQQELRSLNGVTKAEEIAARLLDEQFKDVNATMREQILLVARTIDMDRARIEVEKKIKEEAEKRAQAIIREKDAISEFLFQQERTLRADNTELRRTNEFIANILTTSGNISGALDEVTQRILRMNAALLDSRERMREMLELMRQTAAAVPSPGGDQDILGFTSPVPEGFEAELELAKFINEQMKGAVPPVPDFNPWIDGIRRVKAEFVDFGQFASDSVVAGLTGIAGAVASGVEAWALYGESIGKAMKQALAASLARIAGEATFQGALHAAYALGSLALLDFRGAAQHAIAAAKFFAVAAATGIGARAIAGNTFTQGGGGASAGARGSTNDRNGARDPIDLTRPQLQQQLIILRVESNDSHIVRVIQEDVRGNGPIRNMIINTAGG